MKSFTKATVVKLRKPGVIGIIEVETESVEVCNEPGCNCVGAWGHTYNERDLREAQEQGYRIISSREVTY